MGFVFYCGLWLRNSNLVNACVEIGGLMTLFYSVVLARWRGNMMVELELHFTWGRGLG